MGDAHVDQEVSEVHIVGAVGDGFALTQVREVVHLHRLGLTLDARCVWGYETLHELLLLGVHGYDRITGSGNLGDSDSETAHRGRMLCCFGGLAIGCSE